MVQTIRDDMSEAGLRRLHLLDGQVLVLETAMERVEAEGGRLETYCAYEDEIGMHHLHVYWRLSDMSETMVVVATYKQDHNWALNEAARRYESRFGKLPNAAYVHEGVTGADLVEIRGENGEKRGEVKVYRVRWMLSTDVGVSFLEAD